MKLALTLIREEKRKAVDCQDHLWPKHTRHSRLLLLDLQVVRQRLLKAALQSWVKILKLSLFTNQLPSKRDTVSSPSFDLKQAVFIDSLKSKALGIGQMRSMKDISVSSSKLIFPNFRI
jgi:hypothetical protein